MTFIFGGEESWAWLERIKYRGAIGLFYENTWGAILTFLVFGIFSALAVIGLITVCKWILFGIKRKKKDKYK